MAKVYSWYLYTHSQQGEQYGYIIHPDDAAKLLLINNANSAITNHNDVKAYTGNRLSGEDLTNIKKWTKKCSNDDYEAMFNRLTSLVKEGNPDTNLGQYTDYNNVVGVIDDLRGPRGRGVKKIELWTTGTTENTYRIIFDDGSTDYFQMPRPRDGRDGRDGAAADLPVLQITKTLYASGLKNGEIETPKRPSGGVFDFATGELSDVNGNGSNWYETNSNLTPPIFSSSAIFFSTDGQSKDGWTNPLQITGDDGKPGTDGNSTEFIYRLAERVQQPDSDDLLCYKGSFEYYQWDNNANKYLPIDRKPIADSVELKTELPSNKDGEYIKMWYKPIDLSKDNSVEKNDNSVYYDSTEDCLKNSNGIQREIANVKYIKRINNNINEYYIWGEYIDEYVPNNWTDSPSGVDDSNKTEYCSTRRRNSKTKKWGAWSTPQIWAKYGEKGEDGDGVEYIFFLGDGTQPLNPTPSNYQENEDYQSKDVEWLPSLEKNTYQNIDGEPVNPLTVNWEDEAKSVTPEMMYLWVSSRKFRNGEWGPFSKPSLWAKYGESGKSAYIIREIYCMNDSTDTVPELPNDAKNLINWSVGFPTDYQSGKVVWGSKAEVDGDTGDFIRLYTIKQGTPEDSILEINTVICSEFPSTSQEVEINGKPCKYIYYNDKYFKYDGAEYVELKDSPKDALKSDDRKFIVLNELPSTKQSDYELVKVNNTYYRWNERTKKYHAQEGIPIDVQLYNIKGINTIQRDTLPVHNTGYLYIIYNGEYYEWKETCWSTPYLVTGLRGAPAAPVDRTVDFFCYYSVDSTPNKPPIGITITDGTNEITGMTETSIVDKWKRTPALAPNESTSLRRWYRCTGYVKGETQIVESWGDVSPASGIDGEDGYSYEMRYCVTYTVNPPSLINTETNPTYETNGQITGWFSLENAEEYRQYQDLLIDGCPPMGGAIWKIQARKNGNGEIEGNWSNPERVSGYPGEKGLEGPAGRRGVTGIPGATLNPLYCLGTYYENNINTPGSFYDEVKENLLDYNDFLFGKTILENNLVSQENSILSNKLKLEVNKTYTFTDIPVYSSVSNKLYIAKFNDLNQYLGCDEITPESIVNNYAIAQYTPQNSNVAFYRLLLQSGYNSAVTFDSTVAKIFNKNSETKYYRNGYFGETPVIEPNNDKLKNWFTSPPDTEHIVVNSEAELENAIKYDKLGRVIDYKVVDIEGGYSFITHNYYSVIETSIPIDSNNDNTYHYIYNSNNDINKGNQEINGIVYVFIAEHCYYQWDDNKNAYELINVSNNRPIVTESVKNVTRIPTAKCIDFDYVKKTVYYKWNNNNTMFEVYDMPFNAGNYKLDKQVICENVSGDDEIKKWTTYIWSTQGTKQEVYANTYSYMSGETAYTGETIPSMVNDINVGLSEIQPSDLTTKDSRYKYLKYNNKYYQWSDSLRTYTIYSMTKTPSDIMTDITRSNTIEYAPDGNAQRININGSDFEFGVLEIPTFNLTNCEYLKQTINNVTYYYAFNGHCYQKVVNSSGTPIIPSDATRDNTLIVTPGTTISLLNKVNQQYKYFKEEHQRYNPNVNDDIGTNNETYYVYYSWEDTPNELLETQVNQINWCTPFRIQGINGLATAGNRGQILYPMGVYNENEVYRTTTTKAPYVLDPNDGLFYVYNIVDIPWVGVQPLNFREITEAPSDVTSSNTLDVDSDFIPNWYQKYYDCIQKYGYYEWNEDENRYINLCIPIDARENNTKVIGENDSIANKIEGFDYILFEGKYYEWTDNGYRHYFDESDINDKPIYAVDSISDNLYTEEEHYLLYNQNFYEWDSNENRYKEVTSENIYFNLFQKDVPNSKSFANRIKVYFNYSWNGNSKSYKPTSLANAKTSVHVLPTEKIGYNYFRRTITDSNGVNKTYLKWDFNKNQLVNASIYKYSADGTGAEGSWILAQGDGGLTTPATNYANAIANNTQPAWVRFEHFDALYASIGIIANGMVGSAVFNNEFMFSQQGKVFNSDKTKRVNGSEYEKFLSAYVFDANKGSNGAWTFKGNVVSDTSVDPYNEANEFHPNVCINFKTGQMWLSCGKIKLGAFAINGDDDSEDNNITTKDIISEWGADNILTPQERATLSDTFKAFEVEYEETFGCYTAITGNINGGELTILKNAYDKASSAFTAHITSTAKEVDTLPIEQEGNLLYLKYHNHFYKWGNIPDGGIYRYDEYKINVEVDFYENLPSASNRNTIAYVSGDTINNDGSNEVLHYSGYYVKTDDGWTKLSAEIVKSIPLNIGETSPNYIIVNTDFKSDGVLYEKTGLTQGQAYILADYQNNIDIDNKNTRIFTSGDTMVIYDDEDSENRSYNNILNYYKVRKDLNISVNDSIKTAIATAQSSTNTANVKFEEVSGKLENWAADGMLSPMEIKGLKDEYEQFKAESGLTSNHALVVTNNAITADTHTDYEVYTAYTNACENVDKTFDYYIRSIEDNDYVVIVTGETGDESYKNYSGITHYYATRKNLSDIINRYVSTDITNAITVITGASKDNRIYEGESNKIEQEYKNFKYVTGTTESNFKIALGINDINDIPEDWQDDYTAYTGACASANTAFGYYSEFSGDKLTADALGIPYIKVIIDESVDNSYTHIYNYYTAETTFNSVINSIIRSGLNNIAQDNIIREDELVDLLKEYNSFTGTSAYTKTNYEKVVGNEITNTTSGYTAYTAYTSACASANTAFNELTNEENFVYDSTKTFRYISLANDTTGLTHYNNIYAYYDAKDKLNSVINSIIKDNVNDADGDAKRAIGALGAAASDGVITFNELPSLKDMKAQIESESASTINSAQDIINSIGKDSIATLDWLNKYFKDGITAYSSTTVSALTVLNHYIDAVTEQIKKEDYAGVPIEYGSQSGVVGTNPYDYDWIAKYYKDRAEFLSYVQSATTEYYKLVNGKTGEIGKTLQTAVEDLSNVTGAIGEWAADNILSPMEIRVLKDEYDQFKVESGLTLNHALLVTNSAITADTHTGYNIYTTYTGVCANANTAFAYHTNKPEGNNSIEIANNYNNIKLYYSARLNLSDFIEKYLNDNANERIDNVNERIDDSIQVITGASKDNRIYEGESYKIEQEYENFKYVTATTESNFKIALGINDINDIPEDWQDDYTAYTGVCESANTAFKYYSEFSGDKLTADTLGVYYIPVIIDESDANSYTHIYNYYTAETAFNAVINSIIKSNIDDADSDANRALGALGVTSSDGVITFNELPSLKEMKMQIESESASTIAMAEETNNEALEGIITDYSSTTVSALAVLDYYINAVTQQINGGIYTGVNIVYENEIGDDGTIITYCDYDWIAEYYKKKVELLSEIQKLTNQSYADLNDKVDSINTNSTNIADLVNAFNSGHTYTDGGLVLSNFIGVTDGDEEENDGYGNIKAFINGGNTFRDDKNGKILFASGVNGNGTEQKFYRYNTVTQEITNDDITLNGVKVTDMAMQFSDMSSADSTAMASFDLVITDYDNVQTNVKCDVEVNARLTITDIEFNSSNRFRKILLHQNAKPSYDYDFLDLYLTDFTGTINYSGATKGDGIKFKMDFYENIHFEKIERTNNLTKKLYGNNFFNIYDGYFYKWKGRYYSVDTEKDQIKNATDPDIISQNVIEKRIVPEKLLYRGRSIEPVIYILCNNTYYKWTGDTETGDGKYVAVSTFPTFTIVDGKVYEQVSKFSYDFLGEKNRLESANFYERYYEEIESFTIFAKEAFSGTYKSYINDNSYYFDRKDFNIETIENEDIFNMSLCRYDNTTNPPTATVLDVESIKVKAMPNKNSTNNKNMIYFYWRNIENNETGAFRLRTNFGDSENFITLPVTLFAKTCIYENGVINTRRLESYDLKKGVTGNFTGTILADGEFNGTVNDGIINIYRNSDSSVNMINEYGEETFKISNVEIPEQYNTSRAFTIKRYNSHYSNNISNSVGVNTPIDGVYGLNYDYCFYSITCNSYETAKKITIPSITLEFNIQNSQTATHYGEGNGPFYYMYFTIEDSDGEVVYKHYLIEPYTSMNYNLSRGEYHTHIVTTPVHTLNLEENSFSDIRRIKFYVNYYMYFTGGKAFSTTSSANVYIYSNSPVKIIYGTQPSLFLIGNNGLYYNYTNDDFITTAIITDNMLYLARGENYIKLDGNGIDISGSTVYINGKKM